MSSEGGYHPAPAPPGPRPRNGGDRFYNAADIRRQQQQHVMFQRQMMQMQLMQQQEFQLMQRRMRRRQRPESSDRNGRGEEEGVVERRSVVALAVPPYVVGRYDPRLTNLDRLMKSLAPCIPAQYFTSETQSNGRGRRTREVETYPFFCLEALWDSFCEWSVYGAGVPFLLNGDQVEQYYVPFLSGIQLYLDPSKASSQLKMSREENDVKSLKLTSGGGRSDSDPDRKLTFRSSNLNTHLLDRLSLGDKSSMSSCSSEAHVANLPGQPMFQFLEHEQPHIRRPLADKISVLTSQHPELSNCRSCDLHPASWICVAWYPIYRIPVGETLKDLESCFLTFHSLSTQSIDRSKTQIHSPNTRKNGNADPAAKISLPVFALASYKLKDSIVSPNVPKEMEQERYLSKAADDWLKQLNVDLPDHHFFRSKPPYRR